jgi:hypothetical protein
LPGQPFVYFGSDYVAAIAAYAAWRCQGPNTKTIAWLMDLFTGTVCPDKVRALQLSPRTLKDYIHDAELIKAALGHIPMVALEAPHVATFRDERAKQSPRHVHNEMACLSVALSWAVESKKLASNVAKEIRRPSKKVRERLITHDEYLAVYARAVPSVKLAMVLCVRTLGLPADALRLGPRNLVKTPTVDARRAFGGARPTFRSMKEPFNLISHALTTLVKLARSPAARDKCSHSPRLSGTACWSCSGGYSAHTD